MVFSSIPFLFCFLPAVLIAYFLAPRPLRNGVLLLASLVFYAWGSGALVLLLVVSTLIDWVAGAVVARAHRQGRRGLLRAGVTISVLVNLGLLAYFKYGNFLVAQLNLLGEQLGIGTIAWESVVLPIGISFFTFQSMSYTIDVARGRVDHLRNPLDFALYVALFPQLIAGPIVRYHELARQMRERTHSFARFHDGAIRFCHGLAKKVIIADAAAVYADAAFALPVGELSAGAAWIGVLAYTIQIYFDFSGYSDMAIGLGRMFGFEFPENFRRPYSAISITDFWRRWHITLSNWFRDYLYIPLGGARGGRVRTYVNLALVFVVCGFWHGASWTFLVWGVYHGVLLVLERLTDQRPTEAAAAAFVPLRRLVVLLLVMVGWVFFRATTVEQAFAILRAMAGLADPELVTPVTALGTRHALAVTLLAATVFLLPRDFVGGLLVTGDRGPAPVLARFAVAGVGTLYALVLVTSGSFSPFLYFQF